MRGQPEAGQDPSRGEKLVLIDDVSQYSASVAEFSDDIPLGHCGDTIVFPIKHSLQLVTCTVEVHLGKADS